MRQVGRKRTPRTATVRSSGRGKAPARRGAPTRSSSRGKRVAESGSTLMRWIGSMFFMRHPMLSIMLSLIVLALAMGMFAGGHVSRAWASVTGSLDQTFASAGFAVSRITIEGQGRTTRDEVHAMAGIRQGESLFAVDPNAVRAQLIRLPWVADAAVRRVFPDTVAITLIEKLPFALWKHGAGVAVVERSGAVITGTKASDFMHLPLLIGDGAPDAAAVLMDVVAATKAVASRLKVAERVSGRRWNLILDGLIAVKLPEEGWEREIRTLEQMVVEGGILERDIEVIDLRFADRYIFRLRNGDSQSESRERPT
jgi:cell division protein FtsQ